MEFSLEQSDQIARVTLNGRMDPHSSQRIQPELKAATVDGDCSMIIDVSGLTFITSVGIGILVECAQTLRRSERYFILVGSNGIVDEVFRKIGLDQIIPLLQNVDEATAFIEEKR